MAELLREWQGLFGNAGLIVLAILYERLKLSKANEKTARELKALSEKLDHEATDLKALSEKLDNEVRANEKAHKEIAEIIRRAESNLSKKIDDISLKNESLASQIKTTNDRIDLWIGKETRG